VGFCLRHKDLLKLKKGKYKVEIKSSLKLGSMTFADAAIPGKTKKESIISSYLSIPLSQMIQFPEPIAYLKMYKEHFLKNVYYGFVLTGLGDSKPFNYKKTRHGDHALDKICAYVLKHSGHHYRTRKFWLPRSDDRQYFHPDSIFRSVR
jgi:aminopeptidase-like protein